MKTDRQPEILADRYHLQTLLERTPLGMVWLARDSVLDRAVTVTLVDRRIGEDADARDRLFASARALATASPARVVELLDAGMDDDVPFLVTERIDGETLEDLMHRTGALSPDRAASMVAAVLDALADEHAIGVVHLEVSPRDVVLDDDGRVRVRDGGIAQAAAAARATEATSAPGDTIDARADLWCAGALLFQLLTGRPFDAGSDDPDRVRAPRAIRGVLSRALARDPAARFADAGAMASALRAAVKSPPAAEPPDGATRRMFRTWLAVPVLVAVVAGVVVGAAVWLGGLELGGPLGIRTNEDAPTPAAPAPEPLAVSSVTVLDPPPGDGQENDAARDNVIDGDRATVWSSENYFDGQLYKPGFGLLLDLGSSATVTGFRLETPAPGFRFSVVVGDDRRSMVREAEGAAAYTAPSVDRSFGPRTGRYVLVWITSVVQTPDGAHRAEVSEVRVFGIRS